MPIGSFAGHITGLFGLDAQVFRLGDALGDVDMAEPLAQVCPALQQSQNILG